jgi:hypothetical protein
MQGTSFYTKLSDILVRLSNMIEGFVAARKLEAQDLENSIKKGGFGTGQGQQNVLPSMFPNQPQQNLGFYVPPPMNSNNQNQLPQVSVYNNNMSDMLQDLMRSKPSFSTDIFNGNVYPSKIQSRYQ